MISEFAEIKAWLIQSGIPEGDIEPIIVRFSLESFKTLLEMFALENHRVLSRSQ